MIKNKTMGDIMRKEKLLLFAFANGNHVSNVRMLQSIFKQDYESIILIICNDCTDNFQSEKLVNNLNVGRPKNIKQVYFQENQYPKGEFLSQKSFWDKTEADYIMTIHSGEYFNSPQILKKSVKYLEDDHSIAAVITSMEQWTDDFRYRVSVYNPAGQSILTATDQLSLAENDIRDCMVIYRISALRKLDIKIDEKQTHVSRKLLPSLLEKGETIIALPMSLCRFSDSSASDVISCIPDTYGNIKWQEIDNLLKNPSELMGPGPAEIPSSFGKRRSYFLLLYRLSRFQKLKSYAVLDLLLMICAACMITTGMKILTMVAFVLFAVAFFLSTWVAIMLICNLYFKRNPQRLV